MEHPPTTTRFGRVDYRDDHRIFGIKDADRLHHMHIIGKTGTGKSTLLETMIHEDIARGKGVAVIDPHGDVVERISRSIPQHRIDDLRYFNVPDSNQPYGYNPLARVHPSQAALAASGVLDVFKKVWSSHWGVRMEHLMRNVLLALFEQPHDMIMPDILRLLMDDQFRVEVLVHVKNSEVRRFWEQEYLNYSPRQRIEVCMPIQTRVGAFLADPRLRKILTNPQEPLSLRRIMDEGQILLVNLSKGRLGEDTAALLGALLITRLGLAAFSRANVSESERRPFYVYVDEFQHFTTQSVVSMASELRKYRIGLTLAHQYLDQLDSDIRGAVLGNAGTLVAFRLGGKDAPYIAKEFQPHVETLDLINLPNYHMYLKLMIDGTPSKPFSAATLAPGDLHQEFVLDNE
ncbi:type IV secretion system DNA-binding domain-containing protein [bacterium AH-315-P15]|nr:type IV secretion system DNA-binding domain-containing protein [bacterium AH-315-P15]